MLQQLNRCYPFNMPQGFKNTETRKAIGHYSYGLIDEIGRGFSSKVYKGRDENTQQLVAVKVLTYFITFISQVIDMKMVKQSIHSILLKNEINALKSLSSKNIMKLYDVFQTQNNTYIITEYCDNGDLNNLIKKKGRIEESEAIRIISEVCSGLKEMNKKGFIHRDIKPANILLDKNVPKIADLGFAVQINSNDQISQSKHYNVGTPLYMSPQALKQQGHTERGDVWALGIMFFELIYGKTPFTGQSEAGLLSNILHTGLSIPAYPAISESTKDFIRRCLQVDDKRRWKISEMICHSIITMSSTDIGEDRERQRDRDREREKEKERIAQPVTNIQKDTRSQSQGMREQQFIRHGRNEVNQIQYHILNPNQNIPKKQEYHKQHSANIFQEQQQIIKLNSTELQEQGNHSPLINPQQVMRSKSQKQFQNQSVNITISPNLNSNPVNANISINPNINISVNPQPLTNQTSYHNNQNISIDNNNKRQLQAPIKYKANNDILFSQINFCRFLYKFSQQFSSKQFKLSQGLKEKLMFIIAKNIVIKISKLSYLNDKENLNSNIFNLEDFENYKGSESFHKFAQAIFEYSEKYSKHFEKMYLMIQKQNLNDKKFETIFDKELHEFESFYFVCQQYIKNALGELKQEAQRGIEQINRSDINNEMSIELQNIYYGLDNLKNYYQLISGFLESVNDYKKFQKQSKVESLVDKQIGKKSYRELEELVNVIKE